MQLLNLKTCSHVRLTYIIAMQGCRKALKFSGGTEAKQGCLVCQKSISYRECYKSGGGSYGYVTVCYI